ncbi:Alpha/Beta hydrolase protein [Pisolithus orientalis]|uniref:Alpha/Beta hydrolase protein n=1 Tax=Pisolithus orientalis TaxID=936130 RepID=UPI0022252466|nr:Alpha/Beta hydrolase protein [Pisolithus orientalis]KAI6002308.1 Alpha/Beta hydrolase protein [Pisolithus orientalis]
MACTGAPRTPVRPRTREIIDPRLHVCLAYPLLEANRSTIESIRRVTFTYGSSDVHKLDVYYPSLSGSGDGLPPILIFFYGGGLVRGARSSPPSNLVHNNLGAFFASRGILVVIPDYRFVPGITFPQGSEDVRDAIEWTIKNVAEGDSNRVFLLGHSAGGLHLASYLLLPSLFLSSSALGCVRGVILMGVPCEISPSRPQFYSVAQTYYGNARKVAANYPLSLLRRAYESHILSLPPFWNVMAGSEPRAISVSMQTFTREFKSRGGTIEEFVLEGHDHLSPILALSSGSGEDWGLDVVRWIIGGLYNEAAATMDLSHHAPPTTAEDTNHPSAVLDLPALNI